MRVYVDSSALIKRVVDEAESDALEAALARYTADHDALSGVAERRITEDVVSLARRIGPSLLRPLDAIHLATAILLNVDEVVAYDDRLVVACRRNGPRTTMPGR